MKNVLAFPVPPEAAHRLYVRHIDAIAEQLAQTLHSAVLRRNEEMRIAALVDSLVGYPTPTPPAFGAITASLLGV